MDKEIKFLEWVANFYNWQLMNCDEAYNYVRPRLVDPLIIKEFNIGLAGSYNELVRTIESKTPGYMQLGLNLDIIRAKDHGDYYDFFRERIMFPIHDEHGNMCGFSGRAFLEGASVKYLNSTNSSLFNKSELIFNLHRAIPAIKEKGYAYIVEGFFDVTALHGHMYKNVVASMGTAFSRSHVEILKTYTSRVIIAYDGDSAGREATKILIKLLRSYNFSIKVAEFPDGSDPDSYAIVHDSLEPLKNPINAYEWEFKQAYDSIKEFNHGVKLSKSVYELPKVLIGASRATYEPLFIKVCNDLGCDWDAYKKDLSSLYSFKFDIDESVTQTILKKGGVNMYQVKVYRDNHLVLDTNSTLLAHYYTQVSTRMKFYSHDEVLERASLAKELYEVDPNGVPESYLLDYVVSMFNDIKSIEDKDEVLQQFYQYYINKDMEDNNGQ